MNKIHYAIVCTKYITFINYFWTLYYKHDGQITGMNTKFDASESKPLKALSITKTFSLCIAFYTQFVNFVYESIMLFLFWYTKNGNNFNLLDSEITNCKNSFFYITISKECYSLYLCNYQNYGSDVFNS